MSIIMGLDASTKCSGWCIFQDNKLITYGKIIPEDLNWDWRKRVIYMMSEVAKLIKEYKVDTIVKEKPLRSLANVNTLEQLFCLDGAILGLSAALHVLFIPVEVNGWRKTLGILKDMPKDVKDKRSILKERSIKLANELYNLDLIWKSPTSKFNDDDISDAILIAHSVISLK